MKKTLGELMHMLDSTNPRERTLALTYIGKQRLYNALEACVASLKDDDDETRAMAAWALDRMGIPASAAVPALLDALRDPVFGVRSNAGWALVHLARRTLPHVVVPDVIDVLRDSDSPDARQMAYLVLHNIGGEDAHEAIARYWRRQS
ncbi:HEAT repeat domain-containing protein [bacterium]|nr:HEAT repeat domain-containing protein [bacterium]